MENLEIINNVMSVVVTTEETEEGITRVIIDTRSDAPASEFNVGDTVFIGGEEFVMLEKTEEDCLLITKEPVNYMGIGNAPIYTKGMVHDWLNTQFYGDIVRFAGEENILEREIDMMADDGTGKEHKQLVKVSLLTADEYRKFRELLPPIDAEWWLATRKTDVAKEPAYSYAYVMDITGLIDWDCHHCKHGVRPVLRVSLETPVQV